ncbi:MAG: hypothetical protein IJU51_04255, partial [Clostridia bacterium]|nr:hypothetical protein [Clostridia bacterium]
MKKLEQNFCGVGFENNSCARGCSFVLNSERSAATHANWERQLAAKTFVVSVLKEFLCAGSVDSHLHINPREQGVRVSSGDLCAAEAPTEPTGET